MSIEQKKNNKVVEDHQHFFIHFLSYFTEIKIEKNENRDFSGLDPHTQVKENCSYLRKTSKKAHCEK